MDKEHILWRFVFPFLVVFVVAMFKFNRKVVDTSTVYLIRRNELHPLKNFYIMLIVLLLVNLIALALLESNMFSGGIATIIVSVLLLILQLVIFFGYIYNKYYKR